MDDEIYGEEVLGDDVLGYEDEMTVGRLKLPRKGGALGRLIRLPQRPGWRGLSVAPGVAMPSQGLEQLPLIPSANNGIFTNVVTAIEFAGRPQAPFRAERLLVRVARTGAAGIIIFGQGIFVGRMLQQVQRGNFDIEFYGPTAFGVRLNLAQATPGMDIAIPCVPSAAIGAGDSVAVSMVFLGRTIRG